MLTRKHFIAMAKAIKEIKNRDDALIVFDAFISIVDNPNFNLSKFKEACGF